MLTLGWPKPDDNASVGKDKFLPHGRWKLEDKNHLNLIYEKTTRRCGLHFSIPLFYE